jgi:hypothetical protein
MSRGNVEIMMDRKSQGEPQFTKATYDHKRPRYDPPCPARRQAALEEAMRETAKQRAFAKTINESGLLFALGITTTPKPKQPPFKRRI